ncbi:TetR/AcrR family transcriptional regulator [Pendulispora rubella]|uniref:TetR/AcrR family transcriptional regulator n=1 Tax=Pendulispora rubella TaxID=2741070 RepID=A0ABZ2L8M9_9BACT
MVYRKQGAAPDVPARPRGRPRDEQIDEHILDAALALLDETEYSRVTLDAVAARAGVHRPAIYRRWPTKQHLIIDTFARGLGLAPAPDTGDTRRDLVEGVSTLSHAFSGPFGRALGALVADLARDRELLALFRRRVFDVRRASMVKALERGIQRGDIDPHVDIELVLDLLAAPLYYRVLFQHGPATKKVAQALVDHVLRSIRVSPASSRAPLR